MLFLLLTVALVPTSLLLMLLAGSLAPPILLLLFLIASLYHNLVAPVGNSLIVSLKSCSPPSTDSHVVNNLPGPSSTIAPVVFHMLTASLAPSNTVDHVVNILTGLSRIVSLVLHDCLSWC